MSFIACVLAHQILGIVGSQGETIKGILSNLKTYDLQSNNFKFFIFVNKKWPSDLKIGCKPSSNLMELIQIDLDFEELENFEGSFEGDEIIDI